MQACDPVRMLLRLLYESVESGIVARTYEAAVADRRRRLIDDGTREQRDDLVLAATVVAQSTQQYGLAPLQGCAY